MSKHILETSFHYPQDWVRHQFLGPMVTTGYKYTRTEQVSVKEWPDEIEKYVIARNTEPDGRSQAVLKMPNDGLVYTSYQGGELRAEFAHLSTAQLNELHHQFISQFEEREKLDPNIVKVNLWMMGQQGAKCHARDIDVPSWPDIMDNYDPETEAMLNQLTAMKTWDPASGKLLLWRGKPGLGKTYALRALLKEWQDWVSFSYITDPELFFSSSEYLLEVMMHQEATWIEDVAGDHQQKFDDKWRLIILEDAGELLGKDARQQTGQALSRLLNVVDGILGQGLKSLLLVTTNEEISRLNDAVKRPGRCAINHEFKTFDRLDAMAWLERRGHDSSKVSGKMTLAELYAMSMGVNVKVPEPVGFA